MSGTWGAAGVIGRLCHEPDAGTAGVAAPHKSAQAWRNARIAAAAPLRAGERAYSRPMSGLQCLLYVSTATRAMGAGEIETLLRRARRRNEAAQITGTLLHYGGHFLQVLEGRPEAIERCFADIGADPRHREVTRLHQADIAARRFGSWSMRYVDASATTDRAVAGFLGALGHAPTDEAVRQAIALLQRLAGATEGECSQGR
jgi:hypothetical protein